MRKTKYMQLQKGMEGRILEKQVQVVKQELALNNNLLTNPVHKGVHPQFSSTKAQV